MSRSDADKLQPLVSPHLSSDIAYYCITTR